jgi:hypothetical protein
MRRERSFPPYFFARGSSLAAIATPTLLGAPTRSALDWQRRRRIIRAIQQKSTEGET